MEPLILRDFSRGIYRQTSVNTFLVPQNSTADSTNVNYDTIIGSAVVRSGTTLIGTQVAANKTPLGLSEFVANGGSTNLLVSVFSGASTSSVYYYDTSWHTSGLTILSNSARNRFAVLGNRLFIANGIDAMKSSADANTWVTTDCMVTEKPSILIVAKNRLLASGDPLYRSRVWFSSIIDPTSSPFITWNENTSTGDFIDINPDDGGYVTGLANTSTVSLIFKNNGMYRLDVVQKTTDSANIFNIGALSQEGIVSCQGVVYFYSGIDIRQTNGDYPQQISRLGVQDFLDAIPQANQSSVCAGTDGLNVYFSIGTVTVFPNSDDSKTYTNCVLKFSPRDQTWSVHQYTQKPSFYAQFTTTANARKMVSADTGGNVQTVNLGTTDNGSPIFYELITQEIEFGSRATESVISNQIVVYTNFGQDSAFQFKVFNPDERDFEDVKITLDDRVNVGDGVTIDGNFVQFRWYGQTSGKAPIFEGMEIQTIKDEGITKTS